MEILSRYRGALLGLPEVKVGVSRSGFRQRQAPDEHYRRDERVRRLMPIAP
jgi:hypothetical protein